MTDEDRKFLEAIAEAVLALRREVDDRLSAIELILRTLFETKGDTALALAKLRIYADLLALKGAPSAYLAAFVAAEEKQRNPAG